MKYFILLSFIMCAKVVKSQQKFKPCADTLFGDIENSGLFSKELEIVQDSTVRQLEIIFEQNFDDSVYVLCDNKRVFSGRVKTIRNLGVCAKTVSINYKKSRIPPKVSIAMPLKNNCIAFYPVVGKQKAYINNLDGAWRVELSNVVREYR